MVTYYYSIGLIWVEERSKDLWPVLEIDCKLLKEAQICAAVGSVDEGILVLAHFSGKVLLESILAFEGS